MTNGDYPQIVSDFSVFDMLQVRAEPKGSVIKKFRRNGERHLTFCLNRDLGGLE
jgi:hypothetical protein